MKYLRNVLLVINDKNDMKQLLNKIPNWEYRDDIDAASHLEFCLVNNKENIVISFKKVANCVYRSLNVLPYHTNNTVIKEPQDKDMHNDILFKLCMSIKKKFVNYEILCGIIPCEFDEI